MVSPDVRRESRSVGPGVAVVVALMGFYLLSAHIFGWWPTPERVEAACPVSTTNYQVFVDPTASNKNKNNWKTEVQLFSQRLWSCDHATFWTITNATSSEAEKGQPLSFPLFDPSAPGKKKNEVEAEIKAKRTEAEQRIGQAMFLRGAASSDIVGVFNKLQPESNARFHNVLVVFSDGKESGREVNLEDGHSCVTVATLNALVDQALKGRPAAKGMGRFEAIYWVVPDASGVPGCNSRDELAMFWQEVVRRLAQGAVPPSLHFDTNVF